MYEKKILKKSCENILKNCAKLSKNDSLLIVSEDPKYGWYNKDITDLIYYQAKKCGIKTDIMIVGEPTNDPNDNLKIEIEKYDCALFLLELVIKTDLKLIRVRPRGLCHM